MSDYCSACGGYPLKRGCVTCGMRPVRVKLPPLPTLSDVTRWLRDLNFEYSHPIALASEVALCLVDNYELPVSWDLVPLDNVANIHRELLVGPCGCELVPGDCGEMILVERPNGELDAHDESRWDAVAAARRLLAAARDALKAKAGA